MSDYLALRRAYQYVFSGPEAELVIKDLIKYCHFLDSTMEAGPEVMQFYEGRRMVLSHILDRQGKSSDMELARLICRMRPEEPIQRQEVADESQESTTGNG